MKLRDVLAQRDEMFRNAIAQPLICLAQLAHLDCAATRCCKVCGLLRIQRRRIGRLCLAGALDAAGLARIAGARAGQMDKAAAAALWQILAVQGLRRDEVARLCAGQRAWIAITIGAEEFIVGGEAAALAITEQGILEHRAKLTPLKVGLASHTPLLSNAVQPLRALLDASSLTAPATPVVAGIDAAWVVRREAAIDKLALQLDRTIEWADCLDVLYERGCRVFLELGRDARWHA